MIFKAIIAFLILGVPLGATDLKPWFGNTLEIDAQAACQFYIYHLIDDWHKTQHRNSCDALYDISASTSYNDLAGEIEAVTSSTHYCSFGMDSIKLTGRLRLLNDIVADPLSLVTGVSISQVFKPGLRNLSSFHHGGIECEGTLAAGKEFSLMQYWISRWWTVFGVGVADMGYPWIRGNLSWEHNFCEKIHLNLFANSLWGLGYHQLGRIDHFHGYGSIRHQSIDVGFRVSSFSICGGDVRLEYAYRVFARNCPKGVHIAYASISYPFGL